MGNTLAKVTSGKMYQKIWKIGTKMGEKRHFFVPFWSSIFFPFPVHFSGRKFPVHIFPFSAGKPEMCKSIPHRVWDMLYIIYEPMLLLLYWLEIYTYFTDQCVKIINIRYKQQMFLKSSWHWTDSIFNGIGAIWHHQNCQKLVDQCAQKWGWSQVNCEVSLSILQSQFQNLFVYFICIIWKPILFFPVFHFALLYYSTSSYPAT